MRIFVLVFLLFSSALGADNYLGFDWGSPIRDITRNARLRKFDNPLLISNYENYLDSTISKDMSLFVAMNDTTIYTESIADMMFFRMFGFYQNKLVFTILGTTQMPYSHKQEQESSEKLLKVIFADSGLDVWESIFRTDEQDGTVFNQGGMTAMGETGNTYNEFQTCMGTVTNPLHLQFTIFQMDKAFCDSLTASDAYRLDSRLKESFGAQYLFTRYFSDREIRGRLGALEIESAPPPDTIVPDSGK